MVSPCETPRATRGLGLVWSVAGEVDHPRGLRADLLGDLGQDTARDGRVHGQGDDSGAAPLIPAHLHAGDVDAGVAEDATEDADDTRPVGVPEEGHVGRDGHFEIDPVDTGGPPGTLPDPVRFPSALAGMAALAIPVALIGETTNSQPSPLGQACAPAMQNFQAYFDAARSRAFLAELVGADQLDFLDDPS